MLCVFDQIFHRKMKSSWNIRVCRPEFGMRLLTKMDTKKVRSGQAMCLRQHVRRSVWIAWATSGKKMGVVLWRAPLTQTTEYYIKNGDSIAYIKSRSSPLISSIGAHLERHLLRSVSRRRLDKRSVGLWRAILCEVGPLFECSGLLVAADGSLELCWHPKSQNFGKSFFAQRIM